MDDQQQPENDRPIPDAMSDADKASLPPPFIRAKRLAKLGGPSGSNGASRPPSTTPTLTPAGSSTPQPAEKPPIPAPQPPAQANPFTQLGMKEEGKSAPRITIKPKPTEASSDSSATQAAPKSQEGSLEAWTDRTLGAIFRITLHPEQTRDVHGHRLYFVSGVRGDLEEDGSLLRFTTDMLDSAILESAQSKTEGKPLDYLLGCWKRVSRLFRSLASKNDPKVEIVKEARRVCFSYCIFAATIPDMFGDEPLAENPLAEYLLVDPENDRGICHDFLNEAVSRFNDDESVRNVLVGAIETLSRQLSKMTMNDDYRPYMLAMRNFVRYQPLLVAMAQSPLFLPSQIKPQEIETNTLLGPFFRISPLQGDVAMNYFSSAATRDKGYIANSQRSLRLALQTHQEELFDIANCLIKVKDSREKILDWLALTVNLNHKRRALRPDPKTTSSDAFMVNVTVILDRLCEPFMDATFSKVDRIDIDYLRRSPRVLIKDETKLNADQNTSDEYYDTKVEGSNNFITEIFFLTVAAHHYGIEAANTKLSELQKDLKYLEKELGKMETERHKYATNPAYLAVFDTHLKKYKDRIEKGHCTVYATQGVLLDETTQARSMQFMRYVIVWILRLVAPGSKFPQEPLQLPLAAEEPMAFKCLPEYFLEDICDNFKFITQYMPHIITSTQCEELTAICITFLRSSEYIKSPYLKGNLITILFYGVWQIPGRSKGVLGDVLFAHKFATQHLLHALMKFYIECEFVGNVPGFPGKYSIRYEIFQVIKCIWPNTIYRENLATEARVNLDFFVQFVNLLLNDVTFVLDESFTAFTQIHDLTKLLRNPPEDLDANARQEKEELLAAAKDKAKNYMQLTNETVAMLKLFTEALGDSFTKKEVVVRLAHMLDYNLEALVGPKKANLKVENPTEYGWDPKIMLSEIADVYLNLKDKKSFIDSVATDGRSYRPEYFVTAVTIMQRFALKAPEQIREWEQLAERIKSAKEMAELEEEDLGEIPDEYMDPLLATLMEDPVILPTSRQTLDRSTVRSHLLSDPHDPFNRVPLSIDDVITNDALREEIQKWKSDRLAEKLAERNAARAIEPMDLS
ncbi:ubiquitin conjugation factor E4 [Lentithecium fluviatile CBS 122367]|uniref:Ubiquitin conjugation factor E4 n=1 Tax=Lentithecium fluviatile CBS 122367 TaxID=1168545 RepID=A0A6G1IG87_9PLEO|nr:ubiquitin conjugation factor E4 [Lentithecium fluviatile CBS 122367]